MFMRGLGGLSASFRYSLGRGVPCLARWLSSALEL